MAVRLPAAAMSNLLAQHETGMGYQVVDIGRGYQALEYVLILNAEIVGDAWSDQLALRESAEFTRSDEQSIVNQIARNDFRVLSSSEPTTLRLSEGSNPSFYTKSQPAAEASIQSCRGGEEFLRFSAFSNDNRIGADGSVRAGTYVTTLIDGTNVKTGMDAVRRYALPNAQPAIHRFFLREGRPINIRRGVVAAANGQPGGGAEVILVDESPSGTRYKQDTIPPGK